MRALNPHPQIIYQNRYMGLINYQKQKWYPKPHVLQEKNMIGKWDFIYFVLFFINLPLGRLGLNLAGEQHMDRPKALGFLTTKEQEKNLNTFLKIINK